MELVVETYLLHGLVLHPLRLVVVEVLEEVLGVHHGEDGVEAEFRLWLVWVGGGRSVGGWGGEGRGAGGKVVGDGLLLPLFAFALQRPPVQGQQAQSAARRGGRNLRACWRSGACKESRSSKHIRGKEKSGTGPRRRKGAGLTWISSWTKNVCATGAGGKERKVVMVRCVASAYVSAWTHRGGAREEKNDRMPPAAPNPREREHAPSSSSLGHGRATPCPVLALTASRAWGKAP